MSVSHWVSRTGQVVGMLSHSWPRPCAGCAHVLHGSWPTLSSSRTHRSWIITSPCYYTGPHWPASLNLSNMDYHWKSTGFLSLPNHGSVSSSVCSSSSAPCCSDCPATCTAAAAAAGTASASCHPSHGLLPTPHVSSATGQCIPPTYHWSVPMSHTMSAHESIGRFTATKAFNMQCAWCTNGPI